MALTDKYPIDVSALEKGQVLSPEQLTQITGRKATDQTSFTFAVLALRGFIEENSDFTVKITAEGLRILTDTEAAEYNHRRFRGHLNGLIRKYERNSVVDMANLEPPDQMRHAQNLMNESRYLAAVTKVSKRIAVDSHRRSVPGGNGETNGSPRLNAPAAAPADEEQD